MRESVEIAQARALRNGQKADLSSLAQFERDFRGADWFWQHSRCEPVEHYESLNQQYQSQGKVGFVR